MHASNIHIVVYIKDTIHETRRAVVFREEIGWLESI